MPVQLPRPGLLDEGVLFLDQTSLVENYRGEPIKLLPANRVHTHTMQAVKFGFQPTPFSKAPRDVAVQRGQSVVIRNAFGGFAPSFNTLCRDRLLFTLSAGRPARINDQRTEMGSTEAGDSADAGHARRPTSSLDGSAHPASVPPFRQRRTTTHASRRDTSGRRTSLGPA